ncbi:MAG: hypothetical protein KDD89_11990 [Anaerolineales bacterium]|nr:hypothetical protein [Anaerolineales bacterium]
MSTSNIIEIAIRSPKDGVNEADFINAKNAAVSKLVSLDGIGPEREFAPFQTMPQQSKKVFVGMTRYESQANIRRSYMNLGLMLKMIPFFRKMAPLAGVFLKPNEADFDYLTFANKKNVLEIALLRPKATVTESQFLAARSTFLEQYNAEPEVVASYTFTVSGGFRNKDTLPHFTIYQDKGAYEALAARFDTLAYRKAFLGVYDPAVITLCTVIK